MPVISIFVKYLDGKTLNLSVPNDSSINFVKNIADAKLDQLGMNLLNWDFVYFIFQGKIVNSEKTLSELNFKRDDTLHMRLRNNLNPVRLQNKENHKLIIEQVAQKAYYQNHFRENVLAQITTSS